MATTLDQLPIPQSRTDEFLEFLCRNGVGGGGGGGLTPTEVQTMINGLLKEATFNEATHTLTLTREDGTSIELDLSNLNQVDWRNLSHVKEYPIRNIFNHHRVVKERYFNSNTTTATSPDWDSYLQSVQANERYRILKRRHDSSTIVFLDENQTIIGNATTRGRELNGWNCYDITVPNQPNVHYIGFNLHLATIGRYDQNVMMFEGFDHEPTEFIPSHLSVLINGSEVKMSLMTEGSQLSSSYLDEAILELDGMKVDKVPVTGKKVFNRASNEWNSTYFRIPSLVRTQKGTLLGFGDIRYNTGADHSFIDIGCARSTDNGETWSYHLAMINDRTNQTYSRVMDSTAVVTDTNRIILLAGSFNTSTGWTNSSVTPKEGWDAVIVLSDDDGQSFSNKISLKDTCQNQPSNVVGWLGGVGSGIVMRQTHPGRIILPIQICRRNGSSNVVSSGCIYSDDNGDTWTMSSTFADTNTSENMIIETHEGLIMSCRRDGNARSRGAYFSTDGGVNWSVYQPLHGVFTHGTASGSGCQGSWISYTAKNGHEIGLLSHPQNTRNSWERDKITIYLYDFNHPTLGIKELLIPYPKVGNATGAGYSSLNYGLNEERKECLTILFEDNGNLSFKDISYVLPTIESYAQLKATSTSVDVALIERVSEIELTVGGVKVSSIPFASATEIEEMMNQLS